jgi:membrane protein implicated in regulation of membrane protease activity
MTLLFQLDVISPDTLPLLLITAGLLVSLAEALAPGANFIVVGIGLLGAGLVGLLLSPLIALSPFLLGILVLIFGSLAFYLYHEFDFYGGKGQQQTSDSDALQGKTGRVTERVTLSGGQVKLQGGGFNPYYSARSLDTEIPEGTDVMVVDPGGGNVVTVEALSIIEDDIDRQLAAGRTESGSTDKAASDPPEQDETAATEFIEKRTENTDTESHNDRETDREYER